MKKLLSLVCLMAAFAFTACNSSNDDPSGPDIKGSYVFVEPCMQWGGSKDDVRQAMKNVSGYTEDRAYTSEDEMTYSNNPIMSQISYTFKEGKLQMAQIIYLGCIEKLETMKSDWEKKLNLKWEENIVQGYKVFSAKSQEKKCDVVLTSGISSGVSFMEIVFSAF